MTAKPMMATAPRTRQSRVLPAKRGKTVDIALTSETIAADIAAFKKRGGRIDVLGNTPIRPSYSTFRANNTVVARPSAAMTK